MTSHSFKAFNTVLFGDCVLRLAELDGESIDFVLTDPPYLVSYRDRSGRSIANDDNDAWILPAFRQIHRVMKRSTLCVSFYGWQAADAFLTAWRAAGLTPVGHIVFRKPYVSARRLLLYQHEQAYLLCKGPTPRTSEPISDVIDFPYSGNTLHPTQKPTEALEPLIHAFCPADGIVLDPFSGSGSTLLAARNMGRRYVGIELDRAHYRTACLRLQNATADLPVSGQAA